MKIFSISKDKEKLGKVPRIYRKDTKNPKVCYLETVSEVSPLRAFSLYVDNLETVYGREKAVDMLELLTYTRQESVGPVPPEDFEDDDEIQEVD